MGVVGVETTLSTLLGVGVGVRWGVGWAVAGVVWEVWAVSLVWARQGVVTVVGKPLPPQVSDVIGVIAVMPRLVLNVLSCH